MVHTGENPTKKQTGELEPILPEWLRDIRQQSKDATTEETANATDFPSKVQKNEPPDLLAGLASQAGRSEDEDVPDWLANLNPVIKSTPSASSSSEAETDFFAQFNKSTSESPPKEQLEQKNIPSEQSTGRNEFSEWFSQSPEQPAEPVTFERDDSRIELGWMDNFDSPASSTQAPAEPPKEEEDLGWLRDLEASAKRTGELSSPKSEVPAAPQEDLGWLNDLGGLSTPSQPSAPKEDLSWLNNLGGASEPASPSPNQASAAQENLDWLNNLEENSGRAQPDVPKEDLSWLNDLGRPSESSVPAASESSAPQEDLSWLKDLGAASEPAQPAASTEDLDWLNNLGGTQEPVSPVSTPTTPAEDMSWLNNLGGTPEALPTEPVQPSASQEDVSWLNELSGTSESASTGAVDSQPAIQDESDWLQNMAAQSESTSGRADALSPRPTGPLGGEAQTDMPDWLKSATEEPSLPLGVGALDKLRETKIPSASEQPADDPFAWLGSSSQEEKEDQLPSTPEPAIDTSLFAPTSDSTLSNQDVDSLLSMELPDWLSQPEPSVSEISSQETAIPTSTSSDEDETLAPVELPSWVQAMRPVEAVAETTASADDQTTEKEGPLAGLRGLIPIAPIGSARRPKQISLKLQATDEQQAGAALLEQILAGETSPRTILTSSVVMAQNVLRWALSGLMLIGIGAMILLGTQTMPVSTALPVEVSAVSSAVTTIPENSHVLVVIDYEPSLAGEMEAISGPLLDQIALLRHPQFSFLSTSPNGSALAERLMTNININQPSPAGLGYNPGENYFNLGYLPGGAAGVLEFIEAPQVAIPSSSVPSLSGFSAIVILTDHAESGRVWVEQLQSLRQIDPLFPALANQPLLMVSSAQAGPLLQPYVASGQVTGLINGLSDASRYEFINNSRPGIARAYWDAFGVGLMIAIAAITLGSLWSLFTGIRARRAEAEQG